MGGGLSGRADTGPLVRGSQGALRLALGGQRCARACTAGRLRGGRAADPHHRSRLRIGRPAGRRIPAVAGRAQRHRTGEGAAGGRPRLRRRPPRRRYPGQQHLRRRHRSGRRRAHQADAVAARRRAAFVAGRCDPLRQQPRHAGFLEGPSGRPPFSGTRQRFRLARGVSAGLAGRRGRRLRHRARQSAFREAADPPGSRSRTRGVAAGRPRRRHLRERADREFRSLPAVYRAGPAAARAARADGLHRA